jgi:hypothetical protein
VNACLSPFSSANCYLSQRKVGEMADKNFRVGVICPIQTMKR